VQIIFAGKAHPRDDHGKQLIKAIVDLAARPEFRRKLVFLEDYDVAIARYMVQGCDVWLNTPLRPQEASGTSGMKAQANGVLNVSTLDGWWDEAWQIGLDAGAEVGWAIGKGESYMDPGTGIKSKPKLSTNYSNTKSFRPFTNAAPMACPASGSIA
jgi:glycogen phosphorylase